MIAGVAAVICGSAAASPGRNACEKIVLTGCQDKECRDLMGIYQRRHLTLNRELFGEQLETTFAWVLTTRVDWGSRTHSNAKQILLFDDENHRWTVAAYALRKERFEAPHFNRVSPQFGLVSRREKKAYWGLGLEFLKQRLKEVIWKVGNRYEQEHHSVSATCWPPHSIAGTHPPAAVRTPMPSRATQSPKATRRCITLL